MRCVCVCVCGVQNRKNEIKQKKKEEGKEGEKILSNNSKKIKQVENIAIGV